MAMLRIAMNGDLLASGEKDAPPVSQPSSLNAPRSNLVASQPVLFPHPEGACVSKRLEGWGHRRHRGLMVHRAMRSIVRRRVARATLLTVRE